MEDKIRQLDDAAAIRILTMIAQARLHMEIYETLWSPEMRDALQNEFGVSPPASPASEGDIARDALLLMAEEPSTREHIAAMLKGQNPKTFFPDPDTIVLGTAALVILQTRIRIERDEEGKFTFLIEKKPASDNLLKALVQKLLSLPIGKK